jgi:NAD(P)-dependent dehydrogenase (short-subunit alcohol dehydrogenase family)
MGEFITWERIHMTDQLTGKVAVVTGGNSGIGKAAAIAFGAAGATVAVAARRADAGEETAEIIRKAGGRAEFIRTDITRADEVEALVARVVDKYGRLDCAFNNAGVFRGGPVHEFSEEDWDLVQNSNLRGVWLCMKYQVAQMLRQQQGAIVNNSSVYGLMADAGASAYCASKYGVLGLTKAVALEVAQSGVRVNAVCPGFTQTPMTQDALDDPKGGSRIMGLQPMGRVGTPDEIAGAVLWLCSDAASFVTGQAWAVDGGLSAGLTPGDI